MFMEDWLIDGWMDDATSAMETLYHHQALCRHEHMVILVSIKRMSSFESICLSRYGVPKDNDGRDNNNNYYYYDDDDDVAWAATEVYDDETSCVVLCIEMMNSISIVQLLLFSIIKLNKW